jgi:N-acetylglucosamine repressor
MRKINTSDFRRATRLTPRAVNRQIVLNLIREHQPISRAELARRMGVHRGAMTGLVADLVDTGVVYEEKRVVPVVRGRRPTLLYVRTRDRFAAAVDVRPRRTSLALADYGGRVLRRDEFDTPGSPEALVDELARRVGVLQVEPPEALGGECHGVGVVVPGMVDRRTSRVVYAPRLGWRNVDLRSALTERLGLKVRVESAPIACALARLWLSAEPANVRSFAYVSISEGVGVGLVLKGEVVRGHAHTAGEFGHVSFDPNGPECVCGQRGCWEALAGNAATVARYAEAVLEARIGAEASTVQRHRDLAPTVEEVIRRAGVGEPEAVAALSETGRQIGRGLAAVVSAFNPGRIFVGGEVTAAWDLIGGPIRSALSAGTLTEAGRETPVIPDRNPAEYRLLGAVALIAAPSFAAPKVG